MALPKKGPVEIVFDGPPDHQAGRFVEVEQDGESFSFGTWREHADGKWSLDLPSEVRVAVQLANALVKAKALIESARVLAVHNQNRASEQAFEECGQQLNAVLLEAGRPDQ